MAYSWTYGGVRAETLFLQTTHVRRDILPPITSRTIPIPGRIGSQYYRSDFAMRTFAIDVFIDGDDMIDAEDKVREIAQFLDPSAGLKPLIFDDNPNIQYDAVVSGNTDISQIIALKRGVVTFLIPNAFGYEQNYISIPFNPMELSRGSPAVRTPGPPQEITSPGAANMLEDYDNGGHNHDIGPFKDDPLNADPSQVEQVINHVPRYIGVDYNVLNKTRIGVLVEEGTTNLVSNAPAMGGSATGFTAVSSTITGGGIGSGDFSSMLYSPKNSNGTYVEVSGVTGSEGLYTTVLGIGAGQTLTFSCMVEPFDILQIPAMFLNVQYRTAADALISSNSSGSFTMSGGLQRISMTVTTPANTNRVRCQLFTSAMAPAGSFFKTECWQLEAKAYPTSWHYGAGNASGNVRNNETMLVKTDSMLNGTSGTIQILFSPFTQPQPFGAIFDWGQFSGGNTIDRLCILHGTSVGTSRRTIQMQITNGATTATHFLNRTLTNATAFFQRYWVCARWNLTGNIATGYVKLDVHDFTNNETLTLTTPTAMTPISFASFPKANIGHNHSGGNWQNCIFEQIRFDMTALSDSEISTMLDGLKANNDLAMKIDRAGAFRYPFKRDQMPTLYLPKGTAPNQTGFFTFIDTNGNIDRIKLVNENSNNDFVYNVGTFVYYLRFNFETHTLQVAFPPNVIYSENLAHLAFNSIFFPLLPQQEMTFYVTALRVHTEYDPDREWEDESLEAFREIMADGNTFQYRPRYL